MSNHCILCGPNFIGDCGHRRPEQMKVSVIKMRQQIAERQQQVRLGIGQNLKKYRSEKGLTQVELSDLVGIERTSVTNIEAGKNNMTIEQLLYFCEVFEIAPNDLLKDV